MLWLDSDFAGAASSEVEDADGGLCCEKIALNGQATDIEVNRWLFN